MPSEPKLDGCRGDADTMTTISLATELARHFDTHFRVLILDNEVTVDAFVTDPPLPWARLTAQDRVYRNKLIDQPWTIMSIGRRKWAHGF